MRSRAIRWMEWGPEAFARARREDRPVFLLVGNSWSASVAFLDRDAFADAEIRDLLHDLYVPVRVDRDERPDLDLRYQDWVSAITGQAGWPLLAFLDFEGIPFYGGSRFARAPANGRPGLAQVLAWTARYFRREKVRVAEYAGTVIRRIDADRAAQNLAAGRDVRKRGKEGEEGWKRLEVSFDPVHGGFGGPPKFPLPAAVEWLLSRAAGGDASALAMAKGTLDGMSRGPLRDLIGGGFHRCARGLDWSEPGAEKLLADNAALLECFARASSVFADPAYGGIAKEIFSFVDARLRGPGGLFAGSVSGGEDPQEDPYAWTSAELQKSLSPQELRILAESCGWARGASRELRGHRLRAVWARTPEEVARRLRLKPAEVRGFAAQAIGKLREAAGKRPAVPSDRTGYVGANARLAAALLAAGTFLGMEEWRRAGLEMTGALLAKGADPQGRVLHQVEGPPHPSLAGDHARMGLALAAAHGATGNASYLDAARKIADRLCDRFWDPENGGFLDVDPEEADPLCRRFPLRPVVDLPEPSANGLAALFLARLGKSLEKEGVFYRERAARTCQALGGAVAVYGPYAAALGLAMGESLLLDSSPA